MSVRCIWPSSYHRANCEDMNGTPKPPYLTEELEAWVEQYVVLPQ